MVTSQGDPQSAHACRSAVSTVGAPPRAPAAARSPSAPPSAPAAADARIAGLDGLRALAILAVLIFHVRPGTLRGGFLGVDVFFVVSGFLITTLLARELRAKRKIDLMRFWLRRARRLLPALVVVVVVSVTLAYFAGGDLLVDIDRQTLGALTFSTNWWEISAGSSYFAHTAPLLFVNFWSLAVEEQFYLFWPVAFAVILAITRTGRQRVGLVLGIAAASALLMAVIFTPGGDATRVYYGTDTHLFGLMAGAALALSISGKSANLLTSRAWQRFGAAAACVALVGLLAAMYWLDPASTFAYRGGIALAVLLAVVVVAALAGPANALTRAFSVPWLEWIGARSYGIYLWHWPIILIVAALAPRALPDSLGSWLQRALACVLTIAIAAASYRWIENPIRQLGFREVGRRVVAALGFGAVPAQPGKSATSAEATNPAPPASNASPQAPRRTLTARLGAGAAVVCCALFVTAVATAPHASQVEVAMQEAAEVVDASVLTPADATPAVATPADATPAPADATPAPADATPAPAEATPATPSAIPPGTEISGFGDSMMYVAAPGLAATFPGIALDAESNRQWPDVLAAIQAALDAGAVRETVIIAAGTNAGVRDPQVVEQALDLLGPDRRVVLMNIFGSSYWVPESNANLAAIAAERDNVVIGDWNTTIAGHLDELQPDLVHPDMEGMYLYAEVVQAALATLPAE